MGRHIYVKFDFELPDGFEKTYNRELRHEEYLLEKDPLSNAVFFDELTVVPKKVLEAIIRTQAAEKAERETQAEQKSLLKKALARLKETHPAEEECIRLYFFRNMTQSDVAKRKNVTQQAVNRMIQRGIGHLKGYVDTYKKDG